MSAYTSLTLIRTQRQICHFRIVNTNCYLEIDSVAVSQLWHQCEMKTESHTDAHRTLSYDATTFEQMYQTRVLEHAH